jgi:hypothetical protein
MEEGAVRRREEARRATVALQKAGKAQECGRRGASLILQLPLRQLLEPAQYPFFLHFAVVGCFGESARVSLMHERVMPKNDSR